MSHLKCLIEREHLESVFARGERHGRRVVFTNGCFDLIHPGHVRLLRTAASHGEVLVVGINDDDSLRRLKGRQRPICPASERAEVLLATRWVDYVTVFPEDTPLETIECVRPDVLVKGAEYKEKDIVGAKLVRSYGGDVVRVPMKRGYSTRSIAKKIAGAA